MKQFFGLALVLMLSFGYAEAKADGMVKEQGYGMLESPDGQTKVCFRLTEKGMPQYAVYQTPKK